MPGKFDFENIDLSKEPNQKKIDEEFEKLPKEEKDKLMFEIQERAEKENIEFDKEKAEEIETVEKELSPEVIEKIMDKVQDINTEGVAFSVIENSKFRKILEEGLLGSYEEPQAISGSDIDKKEWAKNTREKRNSLVYFNINQAKHGSYDIPEYKVWYSEWFQHSRRNMTIGLTFDLKKFTKAEPIPENRFTEKKLPARTYRILYAEMYQKEAKPWDKKYPKEKEKWEIDSTYGLGLAHRVAPRFFTGLITKFRDLSGGEMLENKEDANSNEILGLYFKKLEALIQDIKDQYKDKSNFLLPIYTIYGGLVWPKQMTHDQVKKFVAERDKAKIYKS